MARHFNFWKNCAWVPLVCCGGWKLVRRTLDIYYFFYYYWWLLLFLVRASPWTVPISVYLFNVTGSSEKNFVFNYLIKLWIYHQLINYKLIIHFHYILIYLFIYYVFKFIIFLSFQEFRIFREVRFWFWTPAFHIFQPNRRWNDHKGFCQLCGRPTTSAANTDMFDLKLVFVPRLKWNEEQVDVRIG